MTAPSSPKVVRRALRLVEGPLRPSWQVIPTALEELISDPDPGRSQPAMAAMLQMGKIDIDTLLRAERNSGRLRTEAGHCRVVRCSSAGHFSGMASLAATSRNDAPVGSAAVASRPYGVSSASRSTEPPSSTIFASAASVSSTPK
jgi:hypothetical protein